MTKTFFKTICQQTHLGGWLEDKKYSLKLYVRELQEKSCSLVFTSFGNNQERYGMRSGVFSVLSSKIRFLTAFYLDMCVLIR